MGRKYAKLSIGADVILQQIICTIKIRRAPTRHDNMHRFQINYNKDIRYPSSHYLSIVTADKGYDSEEDNHILVREQQHAFSVIPARYRHDVPIWKTSGKYRKQTDEAWLFQVVVQSTKQGWNHNIGHKKIIWRTHNIKTSENTKQRIIIQMYSLQYAKIN